MIHTELGTRVLAGNEGRLFAEALYSMLDSSISMGESSPDWNPVFCRLTHDQQVWMLNAMGRAALLEDVEAPEITAEGEAALAAVYEQMSINLTVEIETAEDLRAGGEPVEEGMFSWRRLVLKAAKDERLSELFGEYVEPGDVTADVIANNADDQCDRIPIWPEETCDDTEEWEIILAGLNDAVFSDTDWLLSDTMLDLPSASVKQMEERFTMPPGYFGRIHPDPLPAQTREILRGLVLFLRRYLGYEEVSGQDVPYFGPSHEEREAP